METDPFVHVRLTPEEANWLQAVLSDAAELNPVGAAAARRLCSGIVDYEIRNGIDVVDEYRVCHDEVPQSTPEVPHSTDRDTPPSAAA